jgi:hypothetical protein
MGMDGFLTGGHHACTCTRRWQGGRARLTGVQAAGSMSVIAEYARRPRNEHAVCSSLGCRAYTWGGSERSSGTYQSACVHLGTQQPEVTGSVLLIYTVKTVKTNIKYKPIKEVS